MSPTTTQTDPAATCVANAAVLAQRGIDLEAALDGWRQRPLPAGHAPQHRVAAGRFAATHFGGAPKLSKPITLEGIDPPWLLRAIYDATSRDFNGFRPAIRIVQADPLELLDGLAAVDLRDVLADERVTVHVGPGAAASYRDALATQRDLSVLGPVITNPALRARLDPRPDAVHAEIGALQRQTMGELAGRLRAMYGDRDAAWWRDRYARCTDDPLRVVVISCRFSSFVKHANRDLADALRAAGCVVDVLEEPDDHSCFTPLYYLRAIERVDPDLLVLVNYPRSATGGVIPPNVPFVCWIQDAMPHHLADTTWADAGRLDYLAGHVSPQLAERCGLGPARICASPLGAATRKFHPTPIGRVERDAFECEIAFATRHCETPEDLDTRLRQELGGTPELAAVLADMLASVRSVLAETTVRPLLQALPEAVAGRLDACGLRDDPVTVERLTSQYALPVADRLLRHETLGWACDLAERHGWRLAIYGRGWETHPRFGRYARGELVHGEPLRVAYQAATVNLHASIHGPLHQRVIECVMSGGLPLCRRRPDDVRIVCNRLHDHLLRNGRPAVSWIADRRAGYRLVDDPASMRCAALLQRLGTELRGDGFAYVPTNAASVAAPPERDPLWPLVDIAETTFADAAELETLVARAVERPAWRSGMSAAMRRRVSSRDTMDAFAARLLAMLRADLGVGEGRPAVRDACHAGS